MEQADIRELEQGHEREGHTSQHSEYAHNPCQGQVLHLITGIQEQHGGHHQVDGGNDDEGNKNIGLHTGQRYKKTAQLQKSMDKKLILIAVDATFRKAPSFAAGDGCR